MNLNLTLLIEVLSFILFLYLFKRFFFAPISKILDKRTQIVKGHISAAQEKEKIAQEKLVQVEERLSKLEEEIVKIKNKAIKEARETKEEIIKKAQEEAEVIIQRARERAERDIKKIFSEFKKELMDIALSVARIILKREVKKEDHENYLEQEIQKIKI